MRTETEIINGQECERLHCENAADVRTLADLADVLGDLADACAMAEAMEGAELDAGTLAHELRVLKVRAEFLHRIQLKTARQLMEYLDTTGERLDTLRDTLAE